MTDPDNTGAPHPADRLGLPPKAKAPLKPRPAVRDATAEVVPSNRAFLREDGSIVAWVRVLEDGSAVIDPDQYGAALLLVAAANSDIDEAARQIDEVLQTRPAPPLICGLIKVALLFARGLYGDNRDTALSQYALGLSLQESTE